MTRSPVDEIAAELIALPLEEFTKERNARAAAASDRPSADAIRALRKPSAAAWVVDLLVRSSPDDLGEALALATALREAQEDLDAATLAQLTKQRRALVAGLARQAARLAADAGVTVSRPVQEDVEKTLNAAMRDPDAADAVMSGRLVRALDVVGFDPVDLDGALAGSASAPTTAAVTDDLTERRARRDAARAAREAGQAADEAARELARADSALDKASDRADLLRERAESLRRELDRIEGEAREADAAATAAVKARAEASDRAERTAKLAAAAVAADESPG